MTRRTRHWDGAVLDGSPDIGTEAPLDLGSARNLVVEDDDLSRRLTSQVLERQWHRLIAVSDGAAVVPALDDLGR